MNDEKERVMRRIRKMLKMAEGQANPNESAVAASMAEKLLRKFNLTHADVILEELEDDDIIAHETNTSYAGRVPTWIGAIIVSCAQLHDCEARYNFNFVKGKRKKVITFLGEKSDVLVAAWVFDYLLKEIRRHTNAYKKRTYCDGVGSSSFRKACAFEVNETLRRMLKEKNRDMQKLSTGKELMIVKRDLVKKKFDVNYRTTGRGASFSDGAAASAGAQAGRGINVRKGIEGNGKSQGRLT
jgi:hypothetical protein